jgi:multidrug efflux pump subunit AcrB
MGLNLSILSMFGIVGSAGVVVNDSLVLIHAANRFRTQGQSALDAIRQAGPMRFRAIILTSLTTFAGLTPMLVERSVQAKFLIPMAVSLAFGVLFATWITLLLIPCGYVIMDDIHNLMDGLKNKITGRVED